MHAERILVTGAGGLIGKHLVPMLRERGHSVVVLSRRATTAGEDGVEVRRGDLSDPASLGEALLGCTSVIHAAGELFDAARMRATNVEGTRNLLRALPGTVRHVVHVSSIGVIGPVAGVDVDEGATCAPQSEYERTKLEAERIALQLAASSGVGVTVLRPTNVFGEREDKGRPDSFLALLGAIQKRRFVFFGREAMSNYVYAGDVAAACVAAVDLCPGGLIHLNDPSSLEEFVSLAAQALHVAPPTLRVPIPIAYAAAMVSQLVFAALPRNPPLTVSRVRALTTRTRYVSRRIPREFDWRPPFGLGEGLLRTVAHYRQAGHLR